MKRCVACGEGFEGDFSFCPIDGKRLAGQGDKTRLLQLTLIEETRLTRRLANEVMGLAAQVRGSWPQFKTDPFGFSKSQIVELTKHLVQTFRGPYARSGFATALAGVALLVLAVAVLEKRNPKANEAEAADELEQISLIDLSKDQANKTGSGIGAGDKGRVGFNRGKGEGSNPKPARAQGGGGGGTHQQLPPSQGRPPAPSSIPAAITRTYARLPSLPAAGLDIDPALWRKLDFASYGDPRSKSITESNGPGEGGGVGTGKGTGIGEGEDNGVGPGRKGNMGGGDKMPGEGGESGGSGCNTPACVGRDQIYKVHDVTQRPRVQSKPEPHYTEAARKNGTTGTVVLRVVFSSSGDVTNIQAVQKLSDGLTEKAIAAARQIRFVPAMRNGRPVSMYMQLQYNFNLF